jgi:hypothetical protein
MGLVTPLPFVTLEFPPIESIRDGFLDPMKEPFPYPFGPESPFGAGDADGASGGGGSRTAVLLSTLGFAMLAGGFADPDLAVAATATRVLAAVSG